MRVPRRGRAAMRSRTEAMDEYNPTARFSACSIWVPESKIQDGGAARPSGASAGGAHEAALVRSALLRAAGPPWPGYLDGRSSAIPPRSGG